MARARRTSESFDEFYAASRNRMSRSLAARLNDLDLATEAVDEAMERAFIRWPRVSLMTNTEGWVYRVAYRWAVDRLRRQNTERRLLPRLVTRDSSLPEIEPRLDDALQTISRDQRAVVVLAHTYDWSQQQIAEALGIPLGTVKSRLHRALAALRAEIGDEQGKSPDSARRLPDVPNADGL